jgi:hypothetical protein
MARLLIAVPATNPVKLHVKFNKAQSHHTYVWMILRQNTSQKLKRLLLQHQSILVSTKFTIRAGKIAHCGACNRSSLTITRHINITHWHHTYMRMVLRQNASMKLKRLLLQRHSILVPTKFTVRVGKMAHFTA